MRCLCVMLLSTQFLMAGVSDDRMQQSNVCMQQAMRCMKACRYEEASNYLNCVLTQTPSSVDALMGKAICAKYRGHRSEAIVWLEEIQKINPYNRSCAIQLSELYRATGQFQAGWQLYLNRFNKNSRFFHQKKIDVTSLTGKTILIHREGEIGDNIMFIRYAKILKEHGAHIVAQVHPALVPLFSLCSYFDEVTGEGDEIFALRKGEMMIWQQSLPVAFDTMLETIPAEVPYLVADPVVSSHWKSVMAADKNFKIGICWQANPKLYLEKNPTTKRSIPLSLFQDIMRIPGISVYSLQKQYGLEQIELLAADANLQVLQNFDTDHGPFMDTAALLPYLDLVLTIDTSIAHLAGALGVKTWVLLPFVAEWRWMENRTDSPWYPTMRLFRQDKPYDWQPVFENVYKEIKDLVQIKCAAG